MGYEITMLILTMRLIQLVVLNTGVAGIRVPHGKDCTRNGTMLTCKDRIPVIVPAGISYVKVTNNSIPMCRKSFRHNSWTSVQALDLEEFQQATTQVDSDTFVNLKDMEILKLHLEASFHHLTDIGNASWHGLNRLYQLGFSNCMRFSFDMLYRLLQRKSNFPHLTQLTLYDFNDVGKGRKLDINSSFQDILGYRGIKVFKVEASYIKYMSYGDSKSFCESVEEISIRKSMLLDGDRRITKSHPICSSLKRLDLSYMTYVQLAIQPVFTVSPTVTVNLTDNHRYVITFRFFSNIEELLVSGLVKGTLLLRLRYIVIFDIDFSIHLTNLTSQNNNLRYLDVEIHSTVFTKLRSLDISNNVNEYISPALFYNMSALRHLTLANNLLYKMAKQNRDVFQNLLMHLKELEHIDLTNNGLSELPSNFFERNEKLKTVILCHNAFKQFSQQNAQPYTCIDLSANSVERLDDVSMNWFDRVDKSQARELFKLIIRKNRVSCSCETLHFITWMLNSHYVVYDTPLRCLWRGESVVITCNTVNDHVRECIVREYLWLIIVVGIAVLCVMIVITVMLIKTVKRMKIKRTRVKCRQQAICDIQNDQFRYNFVAFLLYHPDDEALVLDHINPLLNDTLAQLTGVDRCFICIGDNEFRPGHSIFNEMHRCLTESAIVVAVVSQPFSTSIECSNELEQAIGMQKTMFLLQTEMIEEDIMQPAVKQIFTLCSAAMTELNNDRLICFPSMKHICISILELIQ